MELEWRLATEYWKQTIAPHVGNRRLYGVELFIANRAYQRLYGLTLKSPDLSLSSEGIQEPKALFGDERLKPELLAMIAAWLGSLNALLTLFTAVVGGAIYECLPRLRSVVHTISQVSY